MHQTNLNYWPVRKNTQGGAALSVALIILLVVTILGVNGASETLLSERMSFNHNKQTEAFFAADAGVNRAVVSANNLNISSALTSGNYSKLNCIFRNPFNKSNLSCKNYIPKKVPVEVKTKNKTINPYSVNFYITHVKGSKTFWNRIKQVFQLVSHGIAGSGAHRNIEVNISLITNSPFLAGVVGRKGVTISGNPSIDSYNSKFGTYGKPVTVNSKTFKNTSKKSKKLSSLAVRTCSIQSSSNPNKSLTFPLTLSGSKTSIYGSVLSSGEVIKHGKPSVINGKTLTGVTSKCSSFKNIGSLSSMFSKVKNNPKASYINRNSFNNLSLGQSGKKTIYIANFSQKLSVQNLNINGNVTLLASGGLSLKGKSKGNGKSKGKGSLNIGRNASLKLLVNGGTSFTGNGSINVSGPFVRKNLNGKSTPAFSLYSNHKGKNGVALKLAGNTTSKIAVYAPNSTVKIVGKGTLYGSVIAQNVKQRGASSIHYDEALRKITVGNAPVRARLASWQQL